MVRIQKPTSNVEDGIYTLRIGQSKFKTVQDFTTKEDVQRIEIAFLVLDGESEGEEFTDLFTESVGPRSKLGKLYRAAMKTDTVPDDWDTSDLEGERISALVQANDSGYPKIGIDSIKPAKERPKKAKPDSTGSDRPPIGQNFDEAKRKSKIRQAEQDDDDATWDDEDVA